ncbi:MAG: hypothetical protein HGB02_03640 [Chlorobiaceae bacterium]|nr:hypothetical protein [Chlorobiaceae bacterium]
MSTAYFNDRVLDYGVNELFANGNRLTICSQLPATFADANATYALGSKAAPTISAPGARTGGGRKVTVSAITDGSVSGTGTVSHYAILDTVNSRLLAAAPLTDTQAVTTGNTFTLTTFDMGIPSPA